MSKAPDIKTLYKLRNQIEDAFKTILEDAGLTVFTQRSEGKFQTPSVSLQYTGGNALDAWMRDSDDQPRIGAWDGNIQFVVATQRSQDDDKHVDYVASLRELMADRATRGAGWSTTQEGVFSETELPYHQVSDLFEQSEQPTADLENDLDRTTLTYSLRLNIRPNAWP